jgi:hypothetical protein
MMEYTPGPDPVAGITDPWRYLAAIREQVEKRDRAPYVKPFYDLIAKEHPLHQEALNKEAAALFGFSVVSGRKEIQERLKKARNGFEPEFRASVAEAGILAEMIYRPHDLDQQVGFLVVYGDKPGASPIFLPEIELNRRMIYPFGPKMCRDRLVYLPDSYEEYGSDADLFEEILVYLATYVQVDKPITLVMAAAYILMSWVYDQFLEIPYYRAIGDYGVGKTRLITVVGLACYRPTLASGALTGPAIFRLLEQTKGSLVIDEADFEQATEIHADITKALNVGFQQRYGVLRNEREEESNFQVRSYQVFGPKVLATRRGFKDTALESRCFSHSLPLLDVNPNIPLYLDRSFDQHVQTLRNKLVLWRFRHWGHIDISPFMRFPGMEPRLNQILLPMLAVTPTAPLRDTILLSATESADAVASARLQTIEGRVVETVLWLWWHRPKTVTRILLKSVTERLQTVGELKDIASQKVSSILTKTLDIRTDYKGGSAWITLAPRQIYNLAKQYHIEIPDEGVVELPDELCHAVGLLARKREILLLHPLLGPEKTVSTRDDTAPTKEVPPTPVKRRAL